MTDATHFHNFSPADAVQYAEDGSTCVAIHEWMGWRQDGDSSHASEDGKLRCGKKPLSYPGGEIDPGQWLVRQGDRVWVQDEEPARVERWEHHTHVHICQDGHCPGDVRYPVLSNGWTGPWIPVEGGAE